MNTIHISDAKIPDNDLGWVTLWHVRGIRGYFPTKTAAEVAARVTFPNESLDARYSRLGFTDFMKEPDQ